MIPTGIAHAVIFLFLISPGALYSLLSKRHRPPADETQLQELARIILTSTVTTAIAAIATSWWWPRLLREHKAGQLDPLNAGMALIVTWLISCAGSDLQRGAPPRHACHDPSPSRAVPSTSSAREGRED